MLRPAGKSRRSATRDFKRHHRLEESLIRARRRAAVKHQSGPYQLKAMVAESENARAQERMHLVRTGDSLAHLPNEFFELNQLSFP